MLPLRCTNGYFLPKCVIVKSLSHIRLFATPWTVCSQPGSSVHGVLQARVREWVASSSSRRSSWPRECICDSCLGCWFFPPEPPRKPIYFLILHSFLKTENINVPKICRLWWWHDTSWTGIWIEGSTPQSPYLTSVPPGAAVSGDGCCTYGGRDFRPQRPHTSGFPCLHSHRVEDLLRGNGAGRSLILKVQGSGLEPSVWASLLWVSTLQVSQIFAFSQSRYCFIQGERPDTRPLAFLLLRSFLGLMSACLLQVTVRIHWNEGNQTAKHNVL